MERRATIAEKGLELAEQKASEAMGKLSEIELKLAETADVLSARNKEFADYKGGEKARRQTYYNEASRMLKTPQAPLSSKPESSDSWRVGW